MKNHNLQIKLDGQSHQVDANTVVNMLIHYSALINEINESYGEGNKKIDIKVNALEMNTNDKNLIKIDKEEFSDLSNLDFSEEVSKDDKVELQEDIRLVILKMYFEGNKKWDFVFNGFNITTAVKDKDFLSKIDKGERFDKGDSLIVDLEITKRYDTEYQVYRNKSYRILKVKKHIEVNKQETQNKIFN